MLRGAILGCGMISEFHLRGWRRIPEVDIVALCNRTLSRAEQRRAEYAPGARVYQDLAAMLAAERLDFIDILTTPALHAEHCRAARAAGLHVICQKPLCDNLDAARSLVGDMRDGGKVFAIHENHRYRPWFQRVRAAVREGAFGPLSLLRIDHLNATEPAEAYKNEVESGVWLEYGSHLVDMMRSVLGEPLRVHARMHRLNPRVNGESLALVTFEYAAATAVIHTAWKNAAVTQGSVLCAGVDGEAWYEGTLTRGDGGRLRISRGESIVCDESFSPYDEYVESFYLFERECTDAMLGKGRVEQTGEEHVRTLACTFAAYEAARTGAPVEIA